MKKTTNKLNRIFYIGILLIALIAALIDVFCDIGFPFYSCASIYVSYAFWIALLIYYSNTKEKQETKPDYTSVSMFFCLPFIHIFFVGIGLIASALILNLFKCFGF